MGIAEIISEIRKAKYSFIDDMAGVSADTIKEDPFLDKGYVKYKIVKLKKLIKDEVSFEKRKELLGKLAFYMSNDEEYVSESLKFMEGISSSFKECIYGIEEYLDGNLEKAYELLYENYKLAHRVKEHFLINKVYGLLLVKQENYEEAMEVLKRALAVCPEDMECYHALEEAYYQTFHMKENEVVTNIISLLTSKAWENN